MPLIYFILKKFFKIKGRGSLFFDSENNNITIFNSSFINGTSHRAAGIKLHNMMGKASQIIKMDCVHIKKNQGESTAALEFHSSIGLINFEMNDSIISNNSVKFHAVVSTFFQVFPAIT